jgi:hypothetical protein
VAVTTPALSSFPPFAKDFLSRRLAPSHSFPANVAVHDLAHCPIVLTPLRIRLIILHSVDC